MQIKDIMTREVIVADPEMSISDVAQLLTQNRIHGVPVVEDNKVIGIIVEDDFFSKTPVSVHLPSYIDLIKKTPISDNLSDSKKSKIDQLLSAKAKDIMTTNCLCLSPWMDVKEALRIFKETQLHTFPVIDEEKKLVGVITLADVLNLL
jgi:CBS domain-containing protein